MTSDQIGKMAERLAAVALSRPTVVGPPLMRVALFDDKHPVIDCMVDVLDEEAESRGFFFAQIKGTALPPGPNGRLPVEVRLDRYNRLVGIPAPTYLIGVDVRPDMEEVYILAANVARTARVSSMTRAFRLRDDAVRMDLCREVLAFWDDVHSHSHHTRFTDG